MPPRDGHGPLPLPPEVRERVRALCLALPQVSVRVDESRSPARSAAHSFEVRRRSFCLLAAVAGRAGEAVGLLVLRAGPGEREALLSAGPPFFAPRAGPGRIGVVLGEATDWEEIAELVTDSYLLLAPKKLAALVGRPAPRS